jgi:hypothetical protein
MQSIAVVQHERKEGEVTEFEPAAIQVDQGCNSCASLIVRSRRIEHA